MRNRVALLAIASLPCGLGAQSPAFEVASVKLFKDDGMRPRNARSYRPDGINFGGCSLGFIIGEAYNFPAGRIMGPELLHQGFDIAAKADRTVSRDQVRLMLQSLLADRFKLTLHTESKTGSVYQLVIAKDGPKLEESHDAAGSFDFSGSPSGYAFRNAEMMRLSGFLSGQVDRIVVDQTGLKGVFNFTLRMPEDLQQNPRPKNEGRSPESPAAGTYAEALKPLGLKLVPGTASVDYLVIDHVEHPSEN